MGTGAQEADRQGAAAHREDVRIEQGAFTLAGTLHWPPGTGPHPALVMLQGSGPTDRDNFGYFPPLRDHFIRCGLAVLCFDKPGIGGSSGDWRHETLHDRADHALAAVAFLRRRRGINPGLVGLFGHSQGGWVAPLAAARSPVVAFIIVSAGPGISPEAQDRYGVEHSQRAAGYPEEQIARAVAFADALVAAARRDEDYARVEAGLLRAARGTPWGDYFAAFAGAGAEEWAFYRRNVRASSDPAEVLARVTCPVLAVFGEMDVLVPVAESVAIYERALTRAGNRDVTIRVFPGADHRLLLGELPNFAPGYCDLLATWLGRRVARDRSALA